MLKHKRLNKTQLFNRIYHCAQICWFTSNKTALCLQLYIVYG